MARYNLKGNKRPYRRAVSPSLGHTLGETTGRKGYLLSKNLARSSRPYEKLQNHKKQENQEK
jgi:hypothetical protein